MSVIVKGGGGASKQEKTVTALMTQLIVTPDKGKLFSKVTINPPVIPKSISITTMPSKTSYKAGETLDLTGIAVRAEMSDGTTKDITSECTFSPASGTVLYEDVESVLVAWNLEDITYSTSFSIKVISVTIVTWAGGTDEEIVAMIEAADAGEINLADYWTVGDERQVTLSAMPATGVGESHVEQTVTFVLMNAGGKTLANATASGRTTCSFIVGMKNGLANGTTGETGYMNSSNTNSGGWEACARRTWCNSVFRNAIPSTLRGIFKQHLNITANGTDSTTITSTDYFALPAEKEVFGSVTYANSTAEASLTQFEYYKTSANRIKKTGDSGSAYAWWERSPYSGYSGDFCSVSPDGSANSNGASSARALAPFGCI